MTRNTFDSIDKIYEKAINNTKSSINKPMSFKLLSKGLFNSLTGNVLTRDDEQYGEYAKVLISDDLSKGEMHNAFKTYYSLWKKIPE